MTDKEDQQKMNCPPPQTLADLRRAAGMSQAQVAAKLHVDRSRVAHIEARYPNVQHAKLTAYIEAIGGRVRFSGLGDIDAHELVPDESLSRTRLYKDMDSRRGREQQNPINLARARSAAEELPLQSETPEPGSNDTGREVDQSDPQSDQADGTHGHQP